MNFRDDRKTPFLWLNLQATEMGLDPSTFRLYAQIVKRAGVNGVCYESIESIAKQCEMSESTVKRSFKKLSEKNMVRKLNDGKSEGSTNQWVLVDVDDWVGHTDPGVGHTELPGRSERTTRVGHTELPGRSERTTNKIPLTRSHELDPNKERNNSFSQSNQIHPTQKQEQAFQGLPGWRNDATPNGLKPEFVEYVRSVYLPTTPQYTKSGNSDPPKPKVLNAKNWITRRERSNEQSERDILQNVFDAFLADNPDRSTQEQRDRTWLAEMKSMGAEFYKLPDGTFDQERVKFYKAHQSEVFPS